MSLSLQANNRLRFILISGSVLVLALIGVYFQGGKLGVEYLRTEQLRRHLEILRGLAESPTQYRILTEWLVELWLGILEWLRLPDPLVIGFLSFRVAQNVVILSLCAVYYRRLGLGLPAVLAALAVITWSMTHSLFDSDLSFNLYSDLIFYVIGGVLILGGRDVWLIPLVALAAVNRETCGLIVGMMFLARYTRGRGWDRRTLLVTAASLLAFAAAFLAVRWAFGPRPLTVPHGHTPGLDLFSFNLFRRQTWVHLAAVWSVFPLIALLGFRRLPALLRRWLLWITPIWVVVHFSLAVAAEVRLMLMPQIMLFVPAAFLVIQNGGRMSAIPSDTDPSSAAGAEGKLRQGSGQPAG